MPETSDRGPLDARVAAQRGHVARTHELVHAATRASAQRGLESVWLEGSIATQDSPVTLLAGAFGPSIFGWLVARFPYRELTLDKVFADAPAHGLGPTLLKEREPITRRPIFLRLLLDGLPRQSPRRLSPTAPRL